ncbi:MAG TPA: hypothetical protein VGX28_11485 [Frankiaceae bacterium]|nr:hypothetical protein [Frankiaceae bacterium]
MRTRLLALPFAVATALAVTGAQQGMPVASPNPCAPHEIPIRGRALDGGVGCEDPRLPESPAEMLAARAVFDGPRSAVDGAERLAALRHAKEMRARSLAEAALAGRDAYSAAGVVVPGSAERWEALGPSPLVVNDPTYPGGQGYGNDKVGGRVTALITDPADTSGDTVYMGSAGGGVWKSTNGGETWASVGDDLPSQAIGGLAIDPSNGWLYAGLGEGNTGSNNYAGAGVVRSKDGGASWSGLLPGVPEGIVTTAVVARDKLVIVGTNKGLYRSTDGGDTFVRAVLPTNGSGESDKVFGNFVTDVDLHPDDAQTVLVAVGWRSGGVAPSPGLYRSTDGGASFAKVSPTTYPTIAPGQLGFRSTSTDPIGRISIAYQNGPNQDHDVVYAVVQDAGRLNNEPFPIDTAIGAEANTNNLNGVYRSPDNGDTWTLVGDNLTLGTATGSGISTTNIPANGNYGPGVQAWYNNYVAVDPSVAAPVERVIVGLEEIYEGTTTVAGEPAKWEAIGRYWNACIQAVLVQLNCADLGIPGYTGLTTHADQHAGVFAKTDSGWRYYAGSDGGVYRQDVNSSPDPVTGGMNNDSWTSLNDTLNTTQPYAAAMGRDGTVYLGMQDNGTGKITPEGPAFEVIGGDGFDVAVDPNDSDRAYEEYANGILRATSDGGVSWTGDISPTDASGQRFSTPFELDPTDSEHFIYAGSQVWEHAEASAMAAGTWVNVMDLTNPEIAPAAAATAVDTHGTASYAGWCGLPPTPPAGASACNITTGDGNYDPTLFRRGLATNVRPGCNRAKASAECWRQVQAKGLPNRLIQGIEIDPNDPNTVYVAVASFSRHWTFDEASMLSGVVFKSTDAGETFTNISGSGATGLPQTFGSDPLVVGDRLIVATDVGVFATPLKSPGAWVPFGVGLPDGVPAIELSTNPQGTKLVLATHGRGVWVMPITRRISGGDDGGKDDKDNDGGGGGGKDDGGGKHPATGAPYWVLLAGVPLGGALLVRRRLRASRA